MDCNKLQKSDKEQIAKSKHDHFGEEIIIDGKHRIGCIILGNKQSRELKKLICKKHPMNFDNQKTRDRFQNKHLFSYKANIRFKKYNDMRVHLLENEVGQLAFCITNHIFPIYTREKKNCLGYQVIENDYFSWLIKMLEGKLFVTYGTASSEAVKIALETMGQRVECLQASSQHELGTRFQEIMKELPTFQRIFKGNEKELQISRTMIGAYYKQANSVFWRSVESDSSEQESDDTDDQEKSFVILDEKGENLSKLVQSIRAEPQQTDGEQEEFFDLTENYDDQLQIQDSIDYNNYQNLIASSKGKIPNNEKPEKNEEERKKIEEPQQECLLAPTQIEEEKQRDEEQKNDFFLFDKIRKQMLSDRDVQLNYMTYIYIKTGDFVENQFKNQQKEGNYSRIEIVQFSNEMRHLANQFKSSFREKIRNDEEFATQLCKSFKTMVVAKEEVYDSCMYHYIHHLITGGKNDFDRFYRNYNKV